MTTLHDQAAVQLTSAIRELARETALNTRVRRAELPQFIVERRLRARYGEIDGKQLRALLDHHRIPMHPHGRGIKVHIDDVLRLDELLAAQHRRASA